MQTPPDPLALSASTRSNLISILPVSVMSLMPHALPQVGQPTVYQIGAVAHAPDLSSTFERRSQQTGLGPNERPLLQRLDVQPKHGWGAVISAMADNMAVWGAMVFEAKAAVLSQASDIFSAVGDDARITGEVNVLTAGRDGLVADNTGVAAATHSLARVVGADHWRQYPEARLVILGDGSRATAFALAAQRLLAGPTPAAISLVSRDLQAAERIATFCAAAGGVVPIDVAASAKRRLALGSVIVHAPRPATNATVADDETPDIVDFISRRSNGDRPGTILWDLDLNPFGRFGRQAHEAARQGIAQHIDGATHYQTSLDLILGKIFHDPSS